MYFKKEITTRAQIRHNNFESSDCEKIVCHFYQIKDFILKTRLYLYHPYHVLLGTVLFFFLFVNFYFSESMILTSSFNKNNI